MRSRETINKKNTISAVGQTLSGRFSKLDESSGYRVLFVGNSITLHKPLPEAGWMNECGMAASEPKFDYVHRLLSLLESTGRRVSCAILQIADFERSFFNEAVWRDDATEAKRFSPNLIVVRIGENVAENDARIYGFDIHLTALIKQLSSNDTRIVVTGLFLKNDTVEAMLNSAAKKLNANFIALSDLGALTKYKATEYEHEGVSVHPNDAGMNEIALRIFEKIRM